MSYVKICLQWLSQLRFSSRWIASEVTLSFVLSNDVSSTETLKSGTVFCRLWNQMTRLFWVLKCRSTLEIKSILFWITCRQWFLISSVFSEEKWTVMSYSKYLICSTTKSMEFTSSVGRIGLESNFVLHPYQRRLDKNEDIELNLYLPKKRIVAD